MQIPSPESAKPDFDRAAQRSRQLAVEEQMALIKSRSIQKEFRALKARQQTALDLKKQEQAANFEGAVQALKNDKLQERLNSIHPTLKPKFLPGPDRGAQEEAARQDAEAHVLGSFETTISEIENHFMKERERFAQQATLRQNRIGEFNRSASGAERTQGRESSQNSKGQSR